VKKLGSYVKTILQHALAKAITELVSVFLKQDSCLVQTLKDRTSETGDVSLEGRHLRVVGRIILNTIQIICHDFTENRQGVVLQLGDWARV
jgi:hypothetical protein